jgi:hypothetical protein
MNNESYSLIESLPREAFGLTNRFVENGDILLDYLITFNQLAKKPRAFASKFQKEFDILKS